MVKRYLITSIGESEHPSGDFVHWSDYHTLRAELERVKRERDEWHESAQHQGLMIENLTDQLAAEPAGEVEPRQFLSTEDGEFNGNTFGNGDDVPFGWITQRAYDHTYTTSDPVQVTILRTESGPGLMPRVPLYTTPPDASAIREALERGQAFANQVRAVTHHLNGQAYSSAVSALNYFDAALSRAALAGAKP